MSKSLVFEKLQELVPSGEDPIRVVESKRTSKAARMDEWKKAVEEFDVDSLVRIQDEMNDYVEKVKVLSVKVQENQELNPTEAKELMAEFLSGKEISEFLESRKSMTRSLVFKALDAKLEAEGNEDPENTNGVIEVPELHKKFCREGAGYKNPDIDEDTLHDVLGDDWKYVVRTKVIPEQKVEELDEELLLELAHRKPEVIEKIRNCLVPGKPKSPRFTVRDMK